MNSSRREFLTNIFRVGGIAALIRLGITPKEAQAIYQSSTIGNRNAIEPADGTGLVHSWDIEQDAPGVGFDQTPTFTSGAARDNVALTAHGGSYSLIGDGSSSRVDFTVDASDGSDGLVSEGKVEGYLYITSISNGSVKYVWACQIDTSNKIEVSITGYLSTSRLGITHTGQTVANNLIVAQGNGRAVGAWFFFQASWKVGAASTSLRCHTADSDGVSNPHTVTDTPSLTAPAGTPTTFQWGHPTAAGTVLLTDGGLDDVAIYTISGL